MSTNKVYGDRPNTIALEELPTRWDYGDPAFAHGMPETFSVDQSTHSLFGASKLAADVLVQEYGRYFGMPTCCLRAGCVTGPNHAGVELHGFLSYLVKCNLEAREYRVFGYKGKQVRDNIHAEDVAAFMLRVLAGAAGRRGLQPRRRQVEFVLDPRGVRSGRVDHAAATGAQLRRRSAPRRPHLLLQRSAQDEGALPGLGHHEVAERHGARNRRHVDRADSGLMRIVITGVCGFVGSELALSLRRRFQDAHLSGIDNFSRPGSETTRPRLKAAGIAVKHGDVRCASDLDAAGDADWVIDAAANPSVLAGVDGRTSSRQIVEHNLSGTLNVLEFCKQRGAGLVLLSTSRVYSVKALGRLPLAIDGPRSLPTSRRPGPSALLPRDCRKSSRPQRPSRCTARRSSRPKRWRSSTATRSICRS